MALFLLVEPRSFELRCILLAKEAITPSNPRPQNFITTLNEYKKPIVQCRFLRRLVAEAHSIQ